jgi:cell shape-determining protein MreC
MEPDVAEMLRSTAKNISELFNMMANKVEALEKENAELKQQLQNRNE